MAISVIIPTYKEPEHLKLCIQSALDTAVNPDNEILVYVDGTGDLEGNQKVMEIFEDRVKFMIAKENRGMCVGQNMAIPRAHNRACLVVNDDHVFPKNWDQELEKYLDPNRIIVPNTIEWQPSTLWDIKYIDFGHKPDEFQLEAYLEESYKPELEPEITLDVWRLPFVIDKYKYMALGGWDPNCHHGLFADVEFFAKAKIMGLECLYLPTIRFYHFISTFLNDGVLKNDGKPSRRELSEAAGQYLRWKWGGALPYVIGGKESVLLDHNNQIII